MDRWVMVGRGVMPSDKSKESLSNSKDILAKPSKSRCIDFISDIVFIDFGELKFGACKGLKGVLAGFFANEAILFQIEECEDVVDLFVAENTCFETLFLFKFQLLNDESVDVFWAFEANRSADILE